MAADAARKLATYDDVLSHPEDRVELIGGHIVTMPAPLPRHSKLQRALGRFIGGPYDDDDGFGGPGGWWIFVEVDVRFGPHDVVRPDLAGWRRERLPRPGSVRPIDVVPDWICEIASPSTRRHDQIEKRALYHAAGVPWHWVVDPDERSVLVLQHKPEGWLEAAYVGDKGEARLSPFDAVVIPLERIFLPLEADG